MNRHFMRKGASRGVAMKKLSCVVAALCVLASGGEAAADPVRLAGTFGFGYSNGNYGTPQNTDVLVGLSTLSAETGDLQFNVSVPYIQITGRGLVVFDAAGNPVVINRRSTLPADTRTGFGDANLSTTYAIPPSIMDDFEVKLTGRVKIPTASERRHLSTGKADYGMSVDVSHGYGAWAPFVTVGYLIAGKPASFDLYNTLSVSVGTSFEISDSLVAIASYDFDSASTPLVPASHALFGSLSWIATDNITLTGYSTGGLSSGSPDISGGFIVRYGLN
jgi:hypothetical protein